MRSSQRVFKEVSRLKEQLESKLSEVGNLVTELGALPEKAKRRSSQHQRRRSGLVEPVKSPDQKDWKNRQTLGGVVAGEKQLQEGRLPIIVEGKHYPRKTLESLEISRLIEDDDAAASESPELGPPPVAHFEVAEPIDFAPAPTLPRAEARTTGGCQEYEDDVKPLPDNLERRRRRRASALLEDMSALKTSSTSTETSNQAVHGMPLKSGAKRKLEVREDRDKEDSCPTERDDFAFQRKATGSETANARPRGSRFTKVGVTTGASASATKEANTALESVSRKVLAPKSTNSPSKVRRIVDNEKVAPPNGDTSKNAKIGEDSEQIKSKPSMTGSSTNNGHDQVEDILALSKPDGSDLPPKTAAGLDLFSPVSTEPSARIEQPTEIALSASVEDVLGGTDGRTSRRVRGAVSYAEPSLRAKMRRPTKELVPAVAEQANTFKTNRQPSTRVESQERQGSEELSLLKMRTITSQREKPNDDSTGWNGLPNPKEDPASPLVNKVANFFGQQSPPGGDAMAANPSDNNPDVQQIEAALRHLSVFDGPESSPHDSPDAVTTESRKTSRRHSSNPANLRRIGQEFTKPAVQSDRPSSKNHCISTSERPPRPSSAASVRRENPSRDEKADLKRSASVSTLRPSVGMSNTVGSGVAAGSAVGRTERAAARRRSMMV